MRLRDIVFGTPAPSQLPAAPNLGAEALTAAASPVNLAGQKVPTPTDSGWQEEAWQFYDELGEFRYAVDWKAEMISRVRLRAGKKRPGYDEPELQDSGLAAELIDKLLQGSDGGPDQLMRSFATLLGVPGECWLTGETVDPNTERWRVRSSAEIRRGRKPGIKWEVIDDAVTQSGQDTWRSLPNEALVHRVWEPHPRKFNQADSPARVARPILRELELINRHIQTIALSRLASAGMLKIPSEIDFPVRKEWKDLPNGVVLELIEAAKTAIQTPGSASAAIPMPFVGAAEYLDKIEFIDFFTKADEKLLDKRESAIRRLATVEDIPAEELLGMGDVNHWSAWQLEESGVKVHILPTVERICFALVIGYLKPRMETAGQWTGDDVVWYDASEITMRPDRSDQAVQLYDKLEATGEALRRETGLDEADLPADDELKRMVLLRFAAGTDTALAKAALKELTGFELKVEAPPVAPPGGVVDPQAAPEATGQGNGPPDTQNAPPPAPDAQAADARSRIALDLERQIDKATQVKGAMRHWLRKDLHGSHITHPAACSELDVPCPYEKAKLPPAVPGGSGTYEVTLIEGRLRVGGRKDSLRHASQRT